MPSRPPEAKPDPDPPTPEVPLLTLRDGLPGVIDDDAGLTRACQALAAAQGPIAIDAERASGYRYSARAYLIQLRREGAGTWLIDPVAFSSLDQLQAAIGDSEWILHAATQDLPSMREVGLEPASLFDTELAGRLLGYPRVGLATLVETILGRRLRKEHSAADWSTRPLPQSWLEYAALDVEVLIELRELMGAELIAAGKDAWAREEFDHLLGFTPVVRAEPWRRMSGVHTLRARRALGAARALWEARDQIAAERDITPSRIVPDSALVAAAAALPNNRRALLALDGFHGRGAARYATTWVTAIRATLAANDSDLPTRGGRTDGPPHPRTWSDRAPLADARFKAARAALQERSDNLAIPVENLLTPDLVRRMMWEPPNTRDRALLGDEIAEALGRWGARPWQIEQTTPILADAVLAGDVADQGADHRAREGVSEVADQGAGDGPSDAGDQEADQGVDHGRGDVASQVVGEVEADDAGDPTAN